MRRSAVPLPFGPAISDSSRMPGGTDTTCSSRRAWTGCPAHQADTATLYKLLSYAGVRIVTVSEGEISELRVGLKGTMNALYLKDLAQKTRRGLEGRVREGRSGGGRCFGYDLVPGDVGARRIADG